MHYFKSLFLLLLATALVESLGERQIRCNDCVKACLANNDDCECGFRYPISASSRRVVARLPSSVIPTNESHFGIVVYADVTQPEVQGLHVSRFSPTTAYLEFGSVDFGSNGNGSVDFGSNDTSNCTGLHVDPFESKFDIRNQTVNSTEILPFFSRENSTCSIHNWMYAAKPWQPCPGGGTSFSYASWGGNQANNPIVCYIPDTTYDAAVVIAANRGKHPLFMDDGELRNFTAVNDGNKIFIIPRDHDHFVMKTQTYPGTIGRIELIALMWPSETTMNGKHLPLEMKVIIPDPYHVVLSVLFNFSDVENSNTSNLVEMLQHLQHPGDEVTNSTLDIDLNYFINSGNAIYCEVEDPSRPPCDTEKYYHFFTSDPIPITETQYTEFLKVQRCKPLLSEINQVQNYMWGNVI